MPRFAPESLADFATACIRALGSPEAGARIVGAHLADAHLAGHDSHGVIRLAQYRDHARKGMVDPAAAPVAIADRGPVALLDGRWAWGQITASEAARIACRKSAEFGVAAVAGRNTYHIGRVGAYAESVARSGRACVIFANGHGIARVAPWGGTEPRLATNPIAIAAPRGESVVLVDMTTSAVAEGKVRVAARASRPVPEGWILDREGRPATDPRALYEGGSILPLGGPLGHKGYGLGVAVDILAGILTGAPCGFLSDRPGNGFLLLALDPAAFGPPEAFGARMEEYVEYLKSSPPRPGGQGVLLPGEPEERTRQERAKTGIELDEGTWQSIREVAEDLGVELPRPQ